MPTKCWSLGTPSRPWVACARARPFHGRREREVGKNIERVRAAPLRAPSEVVPRVYAAKSARARVVHALDVLADAAAGRWATIMSTLDALCGHVQHWFTSETRRAQHVSKSAPFANIIRISYGWKRPI